MTEIAYFGLWAQVVLQAKADLEQEPIGSILYNQAADFFVGAGEWAKSRAMWPSAWISIQIICTAAARTGSLPAVPARACRPSHPRPHVQLRRRCPCLSRYLPPSLMYLGVAG